MKTRILVLIAIMLALAACKGNHAASKGEMRFSDGEGGFTEPVAKWPPLPGRDLQIEVNSVRIDAKLSVRMRNTSSKPIRVFKEGNSWGDMNWRVFVLRNGQIETFFENPLRLYSKNTPSTETIPPAEFITRELDLNGGGWCGRGACSWEEEHGISGKTVRFEKGDRIIVTYDVRPSDAAVNSGVWFGVASGAAEAQ